MADDAKQRAVEANFEAFQKMLPELMKTHRGKFALLRNGQIVQFFDSPRDAVLYGQKEFNDGLFSVQQVTDAVVDLGYFSHTPHHALP